MSRYIRFFPATCFVALAAAQGTADPPEPSALVSRAESELKNKEPDVAIVVLWEALQQLASMPSVAANDPVRQSALRLLSENDPNDERRRAIFASIAKQQIELASLYRGKKWLDVVATRVAAAAAFDLDIAAAERPSSDATKTR